MCAVSIFDAGNCDCKPQVTDFHCHSQKHEKMEKKVAFFLAYNGKVRGQSIFVAYCMLFQYICIYTSRAYNWTNINKTFMSIPNK